MSSDKEGGKAAAAGAPKKSKKKLIIIIIAAVALVLAGVGGYLVFAGGSSKKSAATAKPSLSPGGVLVISALTVNLADGHYLKVALAVQAAAGVPSDEDTSDWTDMAISEFSNMSVAQLSTAEGREKAKSDLLKKIQAKDKDMVLDLYFTQFVMQ
jgi:flagellar FliL protein